MFFILIVILNCIQIIALVCMISGPGDLDKNSFEPKEHNLELFLEVGYMWRNLRKILTIEIFISECLKAEKFSLAVKSNPD